MSMDNPVLSVKNLTTHYRVGRTRRPIVRNISFDIAPRETLAVVGESGSGKSITALSIMKLTPPGGSEIEGSVKLNDRELVSLSDWEMRKIRGNEIAMIFQEPMTSLNPVRKIGFQIAESLILHRGLSRSKAHAEAVRLLDKVRVPSAKSRVEGYAHELSGGMRQRVMIAMALACNPKLLIADEPTTALDVTVQAQILDLIKQLQDEEGMSVMFITHDMGVVAEIADRTVVMRDGELIEAGSTRDIFAQPKRPYTNALLASVPRLGAMAGKKRPAPFPVVDADTGESKGGSELPDTVARAAPPVLEVSDLSVRFDIRSGLFGRVHSRTHAVENISFNVRAGETLALVGESGCGKSTTARSVMRLIEPAAGSIKIDGVNVLAADRRTLRNLRKNMQMVFQDPFASLNPRMKVGETVAEPLVVNHLASRAEAREKVMSLFRRVGLSPDMIDRYPHQFSGGQRQRLSIARALALGPRLIVADEAVSALDVTVKAQVINLMLELQASLKLAYLFISHDMAVVERVSHRVAVMCRGEIVEIGPREAIFEGAQHPYTRSLLAAVPIPDPGGRRERRGSVQSEPSHSVRPKDFRPVPRTYKHVGAEHFVIDD